MVSTLYRVIYGDTDQMGVVYYGNYLRYFEAGRNEYLRAKGARYRDVEREFAIHLPVVEATVRYRHSARYDDLLRIETEVTEVRRASLRFAYRIVREEGEKLLAEGETTHACVDREGRPVKLPERLVELLGR
jgi:acyl-CoA thioester hydrolase